MSKTKFNAGEVVPHPVMRVRELAEKVDKNDINAILNIADRLNEAGWPVEVFAESISSVTELFPESAVDHLAKYLSERLPVYEESPKEVVIQKKASAYAKEMDSIIEAAKAKVSADSLLVGFGRALFLRDFMENFYGNENPINIICNHLSLLFDQSDRARWNSKPWCIVNSSYGRLLLGLVNRLPERGNSGKLKVIKYWFSKPFSKGEEGALRASQLPVLARLGGVYRELLLDRMCSDALDHEQIDPVINHWAQWSWVFESDASAYQMRCAIEIASALLDRGDAWEAESELLSDYFSNFFRRVTEVQNLRDGRAFVSIGEAYLFGWQLRFHLGHLIKIKLDFPSQVARIIHEEVDEGAAPSWVDWVELIGDALFIGHVKLAQALAAYVLIESLVIDRRVSDWEALMQIIQMLKREPHFEIFKESLSFAVGFFKENKQELFALRLESASYGAPEPSKNAVRYVIESSPKISLSEVEQRLIEHVTGSGWSKLSSETKRYLINADYNWSAWRFSKDKKEDYAHIGLDFGKAIEGELVSRYGRGCVESDLVASGKVTLGTVIRFLKNAMDGKSVERGILINFKETLPSSDLVKDLSKFNQQFRNPSAHPELFDVSKVDKMRNLLFTRGLLRRVCEELL